MLTIGNALVALGAIEAVLTEKAEDGQVKERKLPFKVKLRLTRIKDILQKDTALYEQERQKLIQEYGDVTEKGEGDEKQQVIEVKDPEKLQKFYEEMGKVLSTELDEDYIRLSTADLGLIEDLELDISENQIKAFLLYVVEQPKTAE